MDGRASAAFLIIEPECMTSPSDDIFLAFEAQLAGVARAGFTAERDVVGRRQWSRRE